MFIRYVYDIFPGIVVDSPLKILRSAGTGEMDFQSSQFCTKMRVICKCVEHIMKGRVGFHISR